MVRQRKGGNLLTTNSPYNLQNRNTVFSDHDLWKYVSLAWSRKERQQRGLKVVLTYVTCALVQMICPKRGARSFIMPRPSGQCTEECFFFLYTAFLEDFSTA